MKPSALRLTAPSLREYIKGNYDYMRDYCEMHLSRFPIAKLEGTYLVWMDCRTLGKSSEALEQELLDRARLWLNAGTMYGEAGEGFMRWNIACPRQRLTEGLERFRKYIEAL